MEENKEVNVEREKEANYIFACALLDELITEDHSEENYNRHKKIGVNNETS